MITVEHLSRFGDALKELRWRARMKQVEVCRATGMTAPQVSRYENNHEMPTVESLVKYMNAVGADLCDLQEVLVAGSEAGVSATAAGDAGEPATPAAQRAGNLERVRDEDDRRLETDSGLRQVVTGLAKMNIEGLERLEHRMRSLEERMEDFKQASK